MEWTNIDIEGNLVKQTWDNFLQLGGTLCNGEEAMGKLLAGCRKLGGLWKEPYEIEIAK